MARSEHRLAPGTEDGATKKDGEFTTIYDAAMDYAEVGTPPCALRAESIGRPSRRAIPATTRWLDGKP